MPLTAELDDGKRWRVCSSRARVKVSLRFTELPLDDVDTDRPILYEKRITRWGGAHRLRSKATLLKRRVEQEDWVDEVVVEAGSFFSRRVRFEVGERRDPPRKASVWLIPRVSAMLAAAILVACLVTLAWTSAATLSTLHLNFSYSDAVTGIGGLTLLGLAGKVIRSVTDQVRMHGVPLYGVGFMLGRTIVACIAVGSTLLFVMPRWVTTVVNDTDAEIELTIPGSPDRVSLRPHQQLTFLGRPTSVRDKIKNGFVKPDRFCAGKPALKSKSIFDLEFEPLAGGKESCRSPRVKPRALGMDAPLWGLFSPSSVPLGCTSSRWEGVAAHQIDLETRKGTDPSPDGEGLVVDFNDACEPVEGAHVEIELDPEPGQGFLASYRIWHPFTFEQVEQTARVAVESEPGRTLRLTMTDEDEEPGAEAKPRRPSLVIDALPDGQRNVSALLPTPFAGSVSELSVRLGSPSGDLQRARVLEQGALRCVRYDTALDSYFRLVPLPMQGHRARVLEVRARSTALPAWESQWNNLRPSSESGVAPRICVVAPSPDGIAQAPAIPPRSLSLSVAVSFPRFGESVALRVPASYAPRLVEITAQSPTGDVVRGSLTCGPKAPDAFVAYELGPLWIEDGRRGSVGDVTELQIESRASDSADAELARTHDWRSQWSTDGTEDISSAIGWFPPWVCRPVPAEDTGCLGCNRPVTTEAQVSGEVRTGRWNDASVFLSEGRAQLRVSGRRPCYLDRKTGRKRARCPKVCEKLSGSRLDRYNRDYGSSCPAIHICASAGESC